MFAEVGMPLDFVALLESQEGVLSSFITVVLYLLSVASGIWIGGMIWRLFQKCTMGVFRGEDGAYEVSYSPEEEAEMDEDFEKVKNGEMSDDEFSDKWGI